MKVKTFTLPAITIFSALSLFSIGNAVADTMVLKNGKSFIGTFVGREGDNIKFEMEGGIPITVKASDVNDIKMGSITKSASNEKQSKPTAKVNTSKVNVAAGTALVVKLGEQLSTAYDAQGTKFKGQLEGDLVVGGSVVAKDGSEVYGEVVEAHKSRRILGHALLVLEATGLKINGAIEPIKTDALQGSAEKTGKKTGAQVLRAAALGALINGHQGAEDGAKVGAGAAILSGGNQVVIKAGTLLTFHLSASTIL